MPTWALALSYWLHLIATLAWAGGLALAALLASPAARRWAGALPLDEARRWHRRYAPWGWLSLAVLTGTGLMQMSADRNYAGFLQIDNAWAVSMLLKHLAVGGLVVIGAYLQLALHPALERQRLLAARGAAAAGSEAMRRREAALAWLHLACAGLVLAFTAIATAL